MKCNIVLIVLTRKFFHRISKRFYFNMGIYVFDCTMEGSAWRGPFDSLEEANRYAVKLGAKVSSCKRGIKD